MKKNIKCLALFIFILCDTFQLFAQDVFDQSLNQLEVINNSFIDAASSFLGHPYNHQNTLLVYKRIKEINEFYKQQSSYRYELMTQYNNEKVSKYFSSIDKMVPLASFLEEFLKVISGYNSSGIDAPLMEAMESLFIEFGWSRRNLDISCSSAYFCEYEYEGFKIMFVRNMLPPSNYEYGCINTLSVTFTYMDGSGGTFNVGGNKYRIIQYKDDENNSYKQLLKATSQRNN